MLPRTINVVNGVSQRLFSQTNLIAACPALAILSTGLAASGAKKVGSGKTGTFTPLCSTGKRMYPVRANDDAATRETAYIKDGANIYCDGADTTVAKTYTVDLIEGDAAVNVLTVECFEGASYTRNVV